MGYVLNFEEKAVQDIIRLKKSGDKSLLKKLEKLISRDQSASKNRDRTSRAAKIF